MVEVLLCVWSGGVGVLVVVVGRRRSLRRSGVCVCVGGCLCFECSCLLRSSVTLSLCLSFLMWSSLSSSLGISRWFSIRIPVSMPVCAVCAVCVPVCWCMIVGVRLCGSIDV